MPLDRDIRDAFDKAPPLDRTVIPPRLDLGDGPSSLDLTYNQFHFNESADKIGRGGNAIVYQATVSEEDLTLALKQPLLDQTVSIGTVKRILGEAKKWARVDDHPYIADVVDWGNEPVPWVAIEYLDGGDLIEQGPEQQLPQRLWTAYAIVDAVAYASGQHGVTHHDLKPENILFKKMPVDTWDIPKVCDWGLAKELIKHDRSISQATPKYAAPEQNPAVLPEADAGVHTDVYQLGVICYELLTGEYPNHLRGEVCPPTEVEPTLPTALNSTILRAMSHERANRYEHPIQFRDSLSDVLSHWIDNYQTNKTDSRSRDDFTPANKTESQITPDSNSPDGGGATLNNGTTSSDDSILSSKSRSWCIPHADIARTGSTQEHAGPTTEVETLWSFQPAGDHSRIRTTPIVDTDTVYIAGGEGAGKYHLFALDRKSGDKQWKHELSYESSSSPILDGGMIYLGDNGNTVWAIDATSGHPEWQFDAPDRINGCSPAVADGTVYVVSGFSPHETGQLHALDSRTGTERWQTDIGNPTEAAVAVANNSVYVASVDGTLFSVATTDGSIEWRFETDTPLTYPSAPAIADGTVYFSSRDEDGNARLFAIDAQSGSQEWVSNGQLSGGPAVTSNVIYSSGPYENDSLVAVNKNRGTTEWEASEPGAGFDIIYADGHCYTGGIDGAYCFDAKSGETQWTFRTGKITSLPMAIANGDAYFVNGDANGDTLYALSESGGD